MDENLFYKGVDKKVVHGARLHQTHSLSDPTPGTPPSPPDPCQPPYPFTVCFQLLHLLHATNFVGSLGIAYLR